ncbi:hypothetical protein EYF80_014111 [Liparis tanakae]|uniref:Uncharacterized protein n=1 Tax=Liparis tanakae TaxID=230148 RepID=A0A4Z2ICP4_9TELE|nr:hypothetical protein EYF80_014111 [Liparis tanakae]
MPLVRYIDDITPTEKAMLTDRNWPLVSLLVFTCAAAEQPNSFTGEKGTKRRRSTTSTGPGGSLLIKVQTSRRLIPTTLIPSISSTSSPGRSLSTGPPERKSSVMDGDVKYCASVLTLEDLLYSERSVPTVGACTSFQAEAQIPGVLLQTNK